MQIHTTSLGCSIFGLSGFGEKTPVGYSKTEYQTMPPCSPNLEEFRKACRKAVAHWEQICDRYNYVADQAMIVAYTISTQPLAEKHLKELGFKKFESGPYPKYKHTATLWCIPTKEFLDAIKDKEKEDDKD